MGAGARERAEMKEDESTMKSGCLEVHGDGGDPRESRQARHEVGGESRGHSYAKYVD
jgi:hypothetical protein